VAWCSRRAGRASALDNAAATCADALRRHCFNDKLVQLELTDHYLLLGLVLGLLVCVGLGGPFYASAMGFAVAGINTYTPTPEHLTFMAVVAAAGMVPPLGLSLATLVRGRLFTPAERGYGKIAWLPGLAFISPAAVPFVLRDPLRVIPATMAGGAVTGVLTMQFGSAMAVPYGSFFATDQTRQAADARRRRRRRNPGDRGRGHRPQEPAPHGTGHGRKGHRRSPADRTVSG